MCRPVSGGAATGTVVRLGSRNALTSRGVTSTTSSVSLRSYRTERNKAPSTGTSPSAGGSAVLRGDRRLAHYTTPTVAGGTAAGSVGALELGLPLVAGLAAYLAVIALVDPGLPRYAFGQARRMVGRTTLAAPAA